MKVNKEKLQNADFPGMIGLCLRTKACNIWVLFRLPDINSYQQDKHNTESDEKCLQRVQHDTPKLVAQNGTLSQSIYQKYWHYDKLHKEIPKACILKIN
jgi:hypothetical protein